MFIIHSQIIRFFQKAITITTSSTESQCQLPSLPSTSMGLLITFGQLLFLQNMLTGLNVYMCYVYGFYATSQAHTLSFGFQQDPAWWHLDDVFVVADDENQQLLINGCFEMGNLTGWNYSDNGGCIAGWSIVENIVNNAHSGTYYYFAGCSGKPDYLSQTFVTTPGQLYVISFWLENAGGTPSLANITIS
ncbi:unnamed protein product [Didymodactylos carnosus]|uniref:DUF642 domain-containing protein n=1 Tax=Didymodactylos carnosus TaxID=1234261 RepID=A0A815NLJ0_9BILA|nr:unnamed protein product [Didymodactylos carnosus]CAF1561361.1 unnamed protein product [Didymodactylos carnosus]CAF4315098.1 unnamed protein product [Didymodactylos carnosus]CAF4353139.1 unnamed protein product [Didymodactylos carnosus]